MDRPFDPGEGSEWSWRDGDEPPPFALGDDAEDDDESDEEESSGLAYGSLLSLGGSLRKKQPCIVIEADEAEQGARLVQHAASHQLDAAEEVEVDAVTPPVNWQPEPQPEPEPVPEIAFEPDVSGGELSPVPVAIETRPEADIAAQAMPLLPAAEPESIDDFRLAPPPVFEYRNGLRRKLVAVQASAAPGLRLVQLLRRMRRWAMRLHF